MTRKLPKDIARGRYVRTGSATYVQSVGPGARLVMCGAKEGVLGDDCVVTIDDLDVAVFRLYVTGDIRQFYVMAEYPVEHMPDSQISTGIKTWMMEKRKELTGN